MIIVAEVKLMLCYGVYGIRNLATGGIYIGSTIRNFQARHKEHYDLLSANRHHNQHLQSSWNKSGEGVFTFEILHLMNANHFAVLKAEQMEINKATLAGMSIFNKRVVNTGRSLKHKPATIASTERMFNLFAPDPL